MVSGGMACVKYLLFLFNLIFAVSNGRAELTVRGAGAARTRRGTTPLFGPLFSASRRVASLRLVSPLLASPRAASRWGGRGLCYISVKPLVRRLGIADLGTLRPPNARKFADRPAASRAPPSDESSARIPGCNVSSKSRYGSIDPPPPCPSGRLGSIPGWSPARRWPPFDFQIESELNRIEINSS